MSDDVHNSSDGNNSSDGSNGEANRADSTAAPEGHATWDPDTHPFIEIDYDHKDRIDHPAQQSRTNDRPQLDRSRAPSAPRKDANDADRTRPAEARSDQPREPTGIGSHPTSDQKDALTKARDMMRAFAEGDRGYAADIAAHFIPVGPALRANSTRATGVDMVIQSGPFYTRVIPATQAAAERNEAEREAAKAGFEIVAALAVEFGIGLVAGALSRTAVKLGAGPVLSKAIGTGVEAGAKGPADFVSGKIAEKAASSVAAAGARGGLTPTGQRVVQQLTKVAVSHELEKVDKNQTMKGSATEFPEVMPSPEPGSTITP